MPTIAVRNMGPNYDPLYGNGQGNFLYDAYAVAQIIGTTLRLFQGEWWENLLDGVPMFQSILGQGGASDTATISAILQNAIYGVPYVNQITGLNVNYNPQNRDLTFSCTVLTAFGAMLITNAGVSAG
jgi:hypothetical protein